MAFYSKRQFAELVGIPSKDLSNYIKRGKVVLKDNDQCACLDKKKCSCLIDDQDAINRVFIGKRPVKAESRDEPEEISLPDPAKSPKREFVKEKMADRSDKNYLVQLAQIHAEKKNEQLEKTNELLTAKISKINEEIIPKDHVIHMIVAQAEAGKSAWMRATETFLTQFAAANQMDREEVVYWRKQLTIVINEAVETAANDSKKNLRRMAREYAGKKGKGEHDS